MSNIENYQKINKELKRAINLIGDANLIKAISVIDNLRYKIDEMIKREMETKEDDLS